MQKRFKLLFSLVYIFFIQDENLFLKRSESKKSDPKNEFQEVFEHLKFSLVDMQKGFRLLEKRIEKSEETIDALITLMNKMLKKK